MGGDAAVPPRSRTLSQAVRGPDPTALGLDDLADKYDIPAVARLASGLLARGLRPLSGEPASALPLPRTRLDPWALADRAVRRGDRELLLRCVATIAEPLELDEPEVGDAGGFQRPGGEGGGVWVG